MQNVPQDLKKLNLALMSKLCRLDVTGRAIRNKVLAIALSIAESFHVSVMTTRTHGRSYNVAVCTDDAVRWTL